MASRLIEQVCGLDLLHIASYRLEKLPHTLLMRRQRLGLRGSLGAALRAYWEEGILDPWGFVLAIFIGLWWWVRGAPPGEVGQVNGRQ